MLKSRKKLLNYGFKVLIAGLLAWALYAQVIARENLDEMWVTFKNHFQYPNLIWLLLTCLLVPVNFAFETLKFRQLIKPFSGISFWRAYLSVVAGTTIAIFTPNRVGEYGGRVLYVEPEHGWKTVIATLVGSLSQLLILFTAGIAGAICFSNRFLHTEQFFLPVAVFLGLAFLGLLYLGFFNIDLLIPFAKRLPYIDKVKKYLTHLKVLSNYSSSELSRALSYAALRYLTYSTQYFFLLLFFGIEVSWLTGMAGIASIFLVQASIPLPPVTGLLARGEIALFIWGFFSESPAAILAATFTLFVLNIAFPALAGLVLIAKANFAVFFNNDKRGA